MPDANELKDHMGKYDSKVLKPPSDTCREQGAPKEELPKPDSHQNKLAEAIAASMAGEETPQTNTKSTETFEVPEANELKDHMVTGHMTEGNDDKVTANKGNQTPPLSPGDKGQAAEGNTNLQTNKATELIAEKETATDPTATATATTRATTTTTAMATATTPNAPNPHRQDPGGAERSY